MRDYTRFDQFLSSLDGSVYPEIPAEHHVTISRGAISDMVQEGVIEKGMRVLDVGCGQGLALEIFAEFGIIATGVTLGSDYDVCKSKGFDVRQMDQNFMDFADGSFDLLWCRHVLEHSVVPLFTLTECNRLTKPGGHVYVEVPAPDTDGHHERNPNHYSVHTMSCWRSLFERAGFVIEKTLEIGMKLPVGTDLYWAYFLKKPEAEPTSKKKK